jgi:hypothetical protein
VQKGRGEDIPDPPISWILLAATHEPTPRHEEEAENSKAKV